MNRALPPLRRAVWVLVALVMLYPMIWMVLSSFKSSNLEIFAHPFSLPQQISFANYQKAIRQGNMGSDHQFASGDVSHSGGSGVLRRLGGLRPEQGAVSAPRALARVVLHRHGPAGSGLHHPADRPAAMARNSRQSLGADPALHGDTSPVAILLFSAYFAALPVELEEAARLDGVSTARYYFGILLPVARPAVATIVVISVLNTWNEFLMALLFIVDPRMKTLPVARSPSSSRTTRIIRRCLRGWR